MNRFTFLIMRSSPRTVAVKVSCAHHTRSGDLGETYNRRPYALNKASTVAKVCDRAQGRRAVGAKVTGALCQ